MTDAYTREYELRKREFRDDQIREKFARGHSTAWIAEEFGLSDSRIRAIVGETMRATDHTYPSVYKSRIRTYLIQEEDGGFVKIGTTTNNVKHRLAIMQVANARTLVLRREIPGNVERELHARFAHLRVRGEWFRVDDELEAFMLSDEPVTV